MTTKTPVRVHIVGAGPVGLLLAALLQPSGRFAVHLYEKRREYTRMRLVKLAPYLVGDWVRTAEHNRAFPERSDRQARGARTRAADHRRRVGRRADADAAGRRRV